MTINSFRTPTEQFLPISRMQVPTAPTTSTAFNTLGDELYIKGEGNVFEVWKAIGKTPGTGYIWLQLGSEGGGGSGINWYQVSVDTEAVVNAGYILQNTSGSLTITLPSAPTIGQQVFVTGGVGCPGFTIQAPSGQTIICGPALVSSSGGSIVAPGQGYMMQLTCILNSAQWNLSSNLFNYQVN